ncbi:MAG: exodeoxyribonuclease VII small subunit [Pseudomonadota bacterium]
MTKDNEPNTKTMRYEEALAELERVIESLESDQQSLDDSVKAYAYGTRLRDRCLELLNDADEKITQIDVTKPATKDS